MTRKLATQPFLITLCCWLLSAEFLFSQSVERLPGAACFAAKGMIETVDNDGKKQSVTVLPDEATSAAASAVKPPLPSIQAGGTMRTEASAATSLLLGSAGTARLKAETEVRLPDDKTTTQSLELLKGRLFLNIDAAELKKRGGTEFKLKTPAALLAVKGTKFFASSREGVDTVGVHEGAVLVQEPVSGKTTEVKAGSAVEIKAGEIGPVRPLSAGEAGDSVEYALAEARRILPPLVVQDSFGKTRQRITTNQASRPVTITEMARSTPVIFAAYNNYDEAGKITVKPIYSLAPGGILRSTTPQVFKKDAVYVAVLDLREADSRAQPHDLMERIAGVQLRYRARNVAGALVTFWYDGTDADCSAPRTVRPAADGKWEEMIVPIAYPGKSASSIRRILVKWRLTADTSALEQPMVLDVSGVSFFVPGN